MTTTTDLLARGYLPKELPPPFTSASLAAHFSALPASPAPDSYALRYSYSKYASVRRALSIPNPVHFIALANAISSNWAALSDHCQTSPLSWTKPKVDSVRAITWETSLEHIPQLRAEYRVGARYVLQGDVSVCYASMYTHAIPWALHTKAVAKLERSAKKLSTGGPPLYGNVLDQASRNIQSGQTIGIPIGPDTSLPLGEAILTEVDKLIVGRLGPSARGFRFVDDYEFVFDTFAEAEHARNVLQDSLAEYELQLNPRKTRIFELPGTLDTPWAQDLAAFPLSSKSQSVLQSQLIRYFSRAFELANAFPGDPVLKYAVRRLSEIDTKSASSVLQQLLFQAAVVDPGTLQTALYIAHQHQQAKLTVAKSSMTRALSAILSRHSALQHGGDIAWALWGAIVFEIRLEEPVIAALEKVTDPIAILMTLLAESKSVFSRPLQKTLWNPMAQPSELFESRWLVAYEAFGHGWLPAATADPASSDPFFAGARSKGVQFIDPATRLYIPEPSPGGKYE